MPRDENPGAISVQPDGRWFGSNFPLCQTKSTNGKWVCVRRLGHDGHHGNGGPVWNADSTREEQA